MTGQFTGRAVVVVSDGSRLAGAAQRAFLDAGADVIDADARTAPSEAVESRVAASEGIDVLFVADAALVPAWAGELAPHVAARNGAMVAAVSVRALSGDVTGAPEAAHGGAALALLRSLATQYGGSGLRANCVAVLPHDVSPDALARHTLVAVPTADDVAQVILFLASEDAAFVTGQVLHCDGGFLAHLPHFAMLRDTGTATVAAPQHP